MKTHPRLAALAQDDRSWGFQWLWEMCEGLR